MSILKTEFRAFINGKPIAVANGFPVLDPSTAGEIALSPDCGDAELAAAVAGAERAFPDWAARPDKERSDFLQEAARALRSQTVPLARLLTMEQGKPLKESINEVMGCSQALRATAELELPELNTNPDKPFSLRRCPHGIVAAVTPWNFPLILAIWKLAPALRMGNPVILKPSPHTPLSTLRMGEVLGAVLPKGVLNTLSGGDELGSRLVNHPAVRMVSLTGSVETGKRVAREGADDLKRLVLELGGNDAAIVLSDTDPKAIAEDLFWGAFRNAGQFCTAIKRLFVHESIYDELCRRLVDLANSTIIGPGMDKDTQMGPLTSREQIDRVEKLVGAAVREGGTILAGGGRLKRPGFFYPPTLIAGLDDDHPLVADEQFGPVLPVLSFRTGDEALMRANATPFGLGGSVWSSNAGHAAELAARLEVGAAWVNAHGIQESDTPLGGWKWSGIGIANGLLGLEEYCRIQTLHAPRR